MLEIEKNRAGQKVYCCPTCLKRSLFFLKPSYGLLLLTGLTMAFIVPIPLTTPWLLTALILYVIATIIGMAGFVPIFNKQVQLLDSEGIDSPNYKAVQQLSQTLGIVTGIVVILITFLMVVKPALWG
jgi:uncharacterized membrane protein